MNWVLIVAVLIVALCMVQGYRKGFLRVIYSLVEWVLVLVFVTWASPYVADFITNHTALPQMIQEKCVEKMKKSVEEQLQERQQLQLQAPSEALTQKEYSSDVESKLEELGIVLPDELLNLIRKSTQEILSNAITDSGEYAQQLLESSGIYETAAQKMSSLIITGIANLLTLIVSLIAFCIIGRMLNFVNKIPLVGGVNQGLGVLAGVLEGILYVWLIMAVVTLGASTVWGKAVMECILQSPILTWLYHNNLLINLFVSTSLKNI